MFTRAGYAIILLCLGRKCRNLFTHKKLQTHARNYTECTLTFAAIYLITIFVANNIDITSYKYLSIVILIISICIIYKLAPLEHRNKPLSNKEKHIYIITAMKITSFITMIFIASIVSNVFVEYSIYSLFAVCWICILLIVGYSNN